MGLDARVEHFVSAEVVPTLHDKIQEMVTDIDVDAIVRETVRREYETAVRRAIDLHVGAWLDGNADKIAAAVNKALRAGLAKRRAA